MFRTAISQQEDGEALENYHCKNKLGAAHLNICRKKENKDQIKGAAHRNIK